MAKVMIEDGLEKMYNSRCIKNVNTTNDRSPHHNPPPNTDRKISRLHALENVAGVSISLTSTALYKRFIFLNKLFCAIVTSLSPSARLHCRFDLGRMFCITVSESSLR
jgi:hypothetical protein